MGKEPLVCELIDTDPRYDFLVDNLFCGSSKARMLAIEAALIDVNKEYHTAI